MIGFNRRFDPNFAALKAAADGGEIGKSELLSITSFDPGPPPVSYVKVSGGLFRDMMIHDFDMACWLMGSAPDKVTAIGTSIVDPEIGKAGDVDTAVVTLRFADGRIAVIQNSRRAVYGYDQRIEFLGSRRTSFGRQRAREHVSKATKTGVVSAKPEVFLPRTLYARLFRGMGGIRRGGDQGQRAVPVTLDDGVIALAVAEAATLSANNGTTVDLATVSRLKPERDRLFQLRILTRPLAVTTYRESDLAPPEGTGANNEETLKVTISPPNQSPLYRTVHGTKTDVWNDLCSRASWNTRSATARSARPPIRPSFLRCSRRSLTPGRANSSS